MVCSLSIVFYTYECYVTSLRVSLDVRLGDLEVIAVFHTAVNAYFDLNERCQCKSGNVRLI